MEEETRNIYRAGVVAFDGVAPEYHSELRDQPTMVWDFHSLLLAIQMMFSFMLVDETATLKLCPNCYKQKHCRIIGYGCYLGLCMIFAGNVVLSDRFRDKKDN